MSSANIYSSEPALPILAHSLLSKHTPVSGSRHQEIDLDSRLQRDEAGQSVTWNLRNDIENGSGVLQCGTIIGFSTFRDKSKEDHDHEYIGQLPRYILAKHLRRTTTSKPKAFIIHPANFEAFSPKKLLASLLSTHPQPQQTLSRSEAISLLDSVQLLPVFDFAAAVQAINEVSNALQKFQEEREQSLKPTTSVMLIIAGLDTLTEGVIRASNPIRGAAVLTTVLRTLTQLSRIHGSYLSVMLVNTSGLGTMTSGQGQLQHSHGQSDDDTPSMRDDGIYSIFSTTETSLFPSLLMRTLDQGIDTHLLISTVKTNHVVEVIKDRVGDGLGKWWIWGRSR